MPINKKKERCVYVKLMGNKSTSWWCMCSDTLVTYIAISFANLTQRLAWNYTDYPNYCVPSNSEVSYHTHLHLHPPDSPGLLLNSKNSIIRTPSVLLISEMTTLLKAFLRWKISHMLISNILLKSVWYDFSLGFKIQECPRLNIALPWVWEFTLGSESKDIKKWIGANVASLSCQISVVLTLENTAPSLRNECLRLGPMLSSLVIKAHWWVFWTPSFMNPDPNVNPLLGWS